MIKNILVTGSSGTIGTRLCEKLIDLNYNIQGADIRPNKWNKKINELTVICDLRNPKNLEKLNKNFDLVIHLAANARVYDLVVDPVQARDNFEMIFNTIEYCRNNNIKRFIFASSREVYGNANKVIYKEDDADVKFCESPYTASKIGGEALVHAYKECYGVNFIIVRFSNVYGMYDESDRVIPLYIRLLNENKDLIVYSKDKLLDFTYIDDAVEGVIKCIEKYDNVKNDVYNIATGKGISIVDLAEEMKKQFKKGNKVILEGKRTGEVLKYIADISKAKDKLDYEPTIDIKEGIIKSIEWYCK